MVAWGKNRGCEENFSHAFNYVIQPKYIGHPRRQLGSRITTIFSGPTANICHLPVSCALLAWSLNHSLKRDPPWRSGEISNRRLQMIEQETCSDTLITLCLCSNDSSYLMLHKDTTAFYLENNDTLITGRIRGDIYSEAAE